MLCLWLEALVEMGVVLGRRTIDKELNSDIRRSEKTQMMGAKCSP